MSHLVRLGHVWGALITLAGLLMLVHVDWRIAAGVGLVLFGRLVMVVAEGATPWPPVDASERRS